MSEIRLHNNAEIRALDFLCAEKLCHSLTALRSRHVTIREVWIQKYPWPCNSLFNSCLERILLNIEGTTGTQTLNLQSLIILDDMKRFEGIKLP